MAYNGNVAISKNVLSETYIQILAQNLIEKGFVTVDNVPATITKLSELENDTHFITADQVVVDNAMSSTSTNPVQNKVIYDEVGGIRALLEEI